MSTISSSSIRDSIQLAANGRHKLVLVIGESGTGKSKLLGEVASELQFQLLNLGTLLGTRLQTVAPKKRPLAIEDIVRESIHPDRIGTCIDNTDILFAPSLKCDPLRFAHSISQNSTVIYALHGRVDGKRFIRGYPDHPEFYSEELPPVAVISVERGTPSIQIFR